MKYYYKLFTGFIICILLLIFTFPATDCMAADITVYKQKDSRWSNYAYGYADTAKKDPTNIGRSGCGLLTYTNAVYYMTNGKVFINPTVLADFSLSNGCRINGSGTTSAIYKKFADSKGKKYGIAYVGEYTSYSKLKENLKKGYAAACHIPGKHWMCIADYSSSSDKYLLLDSEPSSSRGTTNGYAWKTQSQLSSIGVDTDFWVIKSTAPEKPTITSWSTVDDYGIKIKWGKASGAVSYNIDRRKKIPGATSEYETIKTGVKETEYTETGLEAGTIYYYKVIAVNSTGDTARSDSCRVWTRSRSPVCTALNAHSIKISWNPIQFAETYRIDRRVGREGTEYSTIVTGLSQATTTYVDTGVSPGTPYYYRVYPVAGADCDHITVRSSTSAMVQTPDSYYLDLNGYLGTNKDVGNIEGYGTADVYINGKLVADDVTDYYNQWDEGTSYEIRDIKPASGKHYYGTTEGSVSGKLTSKTSVRLHFGTMCMNGTQVIPDGEYVIASAADPSKVLDVKDAGTTDATNLQLNTNKGLKSQIFKIRYMGDGYYAISDTNSGLSIHVQGSGTTDGTNVHMWNSIYGPNAQWVIKKTSDGYYNLITHCSSMYMDIEGGATADGTNIGIHSGNGSMAQKFELRRIDREAPVVTGGFLSDVSSEQCTLNLTASDNVGVDRVEVHSWYDKWSREGEVVYNASRSGDTWICKIPVNILDEKTWIMDVRVYDAAGNQALLPDGGTTMCASMRKINVTLDKNRGGCPEESLQVVCASFTNKQNGNVTFYLPYGDLPTPVRYCYEFAGWYSGDEAVRSDTLVKNGQDHILTARWKKIDEPQELVLPSSLQEIDEEIFEGGNFEYVRLPEGAKRIRNRAFANCKRLISIYIPSATTSIAEDAFNGCPDNMTIFGLQGSYAEFYAEKYGFEFVEIK